MSLTGARGEAKEHHHDSSYIFFVFISYTFHRSFDQTIRDPESVQYVSDVGGTYSCTT